MKEFTFLCKQGQSLAVCLALKELGLKPKVKLYDGKRGRGILVSCKKEKYSKRKIDRHLYDKGIPGAVSRKNKYKVYNFDRMDLGLREILYGNFPVKMIGVVNGKMYRITYDYSMSMCPCCGPELHVTGTRNGTTHKLL